MTSPTRRPGVRTLVAVAVVVLVVAAMVLDTRFLSPEEAAATRPESFDAETYAADAFPKVAAGIEDRAVDIADLAPAYLQDPAGASDQFGTDLGSGKFAFPVSASGEVSEADENFLTLSVPGVPDRATVRVAVGTPVNGTPVRDALGNITFGDFPGQTDFQSVSNQFKLIIEQQVLADVDPASLEGQQVQVYGAWATGGPPDSFNIQPVSIEAAP